MAPKLVCILNENLVKLQHFFGVVIDKLILKCFVEMQSGNAGITWWTGSRQLRPALSGPLETLVYFLL